MPKRIPIADAKRLVQKHNLRQIVLVAFDGERTHVVTYGKSLLESDAAAAGGNAVKRALGWPDGLCDAVSSRVSTALERERHARRNAEKVAADAIADRNRAERDRDFARAERDRLKQHISSNL